MMRLAHGVDGEFREFSDGGKGRREKTTDFVFRDRENLRVGGIAGFDGEGSERRCGHGGPW